MKKKLIKKVLLIAMLLVTLVIAFALFQTTDDIDARLSDIDEKLNRFYESSRMGGFAVSVFNADTVIYSQGIGYSDVAMKKPYTTETQQYIASISKTTIGIALLKAEELGLLQIESPINDYLPFEVSNPSFPKDEITLKQLATHTSSFDYNEPVVESLYIEEAKKEMSLESFMLDYFQNEKYGAVAFTEDKPGTNWNYSNIGAGLAAYIIERRSGVTFSDFTQTHIFKPLALVDTYWTESESDSMLHTSYYQQAGDSIEQVSTSGIILYPCRDMITDVEGLTTYCQAIISRDSVLLSTKSFDKLLSPQLNSSVTNMEDDSNGLFFFIDRGNFGINYQLTGMDGGDNCIQTMMWFDPETELGYIFMGNTGGAELNRVNHILIYNTLVSLGYNYSVSNSTLGDRLAYGWHNVYNRVRALVS